MGWYEGLGMSIFHFYLWLNPEQDFDVKDNILRNMDLTLDYRPQEASSFHAGASKP